MDERCFRPEEPETIYACETGLPPEESDPFGRERARVRLQSYQEAYTVEQEPAENGTPRRQHFPAKPEVVDEMTMGVFERMFEVK